MRDEIPARFPALVRTMAIVVVTGFLAVADHASAQYDEIDPEFLVDGQLVVKAADDAAVDRLGAKIETLRGADPVAHAERRPRAAVLKNNERLPPLNEGRHPRLPEQALVCGTPRVTRRRLARGAQRGPMPAVTCAASEGMKSLRGTPAGCSTIQRRKRKIPPLRPT